MQRILVADDNSNIQKMVAQALQDTSIEVISVSNGGAAIRALSQATPDLVLADVFMPVRSGYEVCEFIKHEPPYAHIPVVLLVGAFDPLDEQEAQRVSADGILKKPFVPPDPLINMVKALLAKAAGERLATEAVAVGASAAKQERAAMASLATRASEPAPSADFSDAPADEFAMPSAPPDFSLPDAPLAFGNLFDTPAMEETTVTAKRDPVLGQPMFGGVESEEFSGPEGDDIQEHNWHKSFRSMAVAGAEELPAEAEAAQREPLPPIEFGGNANENIEAMFAPVAETELDDEPSLLHPFDRPITPHNESPLDLEPPAEIAGAVSDLEIEPSLWERKPEPELELETGLMQGIGIDTENETIESVPPAEAAGAKDLSDAGDLAARTEPADSAAEIKLPATAAATESERASDVSGAVPDASASWMSKIKPVFPGSESLWARPGQRAEESPAVAPEADAPALPAQEAAKPTFWPVAFEPATFAAEVIAELSEASSATASASAAPVAEPEPDAVAEPAAQEPTEERDEAHIAEMDDLSGDAALAATVDDSKPAEHKIDKSQPEAPSATAEDFENAAPSSASAAAADPAFIEAVVTRIVDRMQPKVIEVVTREILRPLVEALVRREISKH